MDVAVPQKNPSADFAFIHSKAMERSSHCCSKGARWFVSMFAVERVVVSEFS